MTVFNFLEGTRFTAEKHQRQESPYQYLLKPKAGGIGYVIGAMGESIHSVLDVTIAYPGNPEPSLWFFMCGQLQPVRIRIRTRQIPEQFLNKNYTEDDTFRSEIQQWVSELWQDKDALLQQLNKVTDVDANLPT